MDLSKLNREQRIAAETLEGPVLILAGAGSGKTTVTCGLLHLLKKKGLHPVSMKCGPDFIDPMFHTKVIDVPGRNLDTFFTPPSLTRALLAKNSKASDLVVLEGVMGYYDGLGAATDRASSCGSYEAPCHPCCSGPWDEPFCTSADPGLSGL